MNPIIALLVAGVCQFDNNEFGHTPADAMPMPALYSGGIASPENLVGESLIACGADYSWGRQEVIGSEPSGLVLWGVNDDGRANLTSPIDAGIVVPGSLHPATTARITVEAYGQVNLKLEAFGPAGDLLRTTYSPYVAIPGHAIIVESATGDPEFAAFRLSIDGAANMGFELTKVWIRDPVGLDISPPRVVGVQVDGLSWRVDGHSLPLGTADQTRPLPFTRVNQIAIVFNEPVDFGDDQLTLTDAAGNAFELFGPLTLPDSEAGTFTAVWQLENFLDIGRYELRLGDDVLDGNGNSLDGEWTDNASVESGDGEAGGDFVYSFNVLPGDVNQDGLVSILDAIEVRNSQGIAAVDPAYNILLDIDARGSADPVDMYAALARGYDVLPPLPAGSPSTVPEPSADCVLPGEFGDGKARVCRW